MVPLPRARDAETVVSAGRRPWRRREAIEDQMKRALEQIARVVARSRAALARRRDRGHLIAVRVAAERATRPHWEG